MLLGLSGRARRPSPVIDNPPAVPTDVGAPSALLSSRSRSGVCVERVPDEGALSHWSRLAAGSARDEIVSRCERDRRSMDRPGGRSARRLPPRRTSAGSRRSRCASCSRWFGTGRSRAILRERVSSGRRRSFQPAISTRMRRRLSGGDAGRDGSASQSARRTTPATSSLWVVAPPALRDVRDRAPGERERRGHLAEARGPRRVEVLRRGFADGRAG